MSGDDPKSVEFPKAEASPEERARRLRIEVDRLARLPVVEWSTTSIGGLPKSTASRLPPEGDGRGDHQSEREKSARRQG